MTTSETRRTTLSSLTRRKVIQALAGICWSGDIGELEFLSRLYDLDQLPSTDARFDDAARDIIQHRIANDDWDDLWIFSDERFGLRSGRDETFLRFIAESVHPEVREDSDQAEKIVRDVNTHLARDGWELVQVGDVSGYPVYGPRRRTPSTTPIPEGFPLDPESLTSSIAEMLKSRGQARELAVLANSQIRIEQASYDNWNGGITGWGIVCSLNVSLYSRLAPDERTQCEDGLKYAAVDFFRPFSNDFLERVVIAPATEVRGGWRAAAYEWLSGIGINNQGRVRSANVASLEVDGLLFRSEPEINLYRAFKRKRVTFAPLPVFLRGGESYARLEPDFVLLKDGCVLVVEVDGDTFHRESPADAHRRLLPLDHEGAKIERVTAQECETPEKAGVCADRLLGVVERLIRRR
jgi:AbiJ N-terminal domain 3